MALLAGCTASLDTDYASLGLVEIAGRVTLDGQPLAGAAVYFIAPDQTFSYGVTDAHGRYQLMFNSERSGVIPGLKRVELSTARLPLAARDGWGGDESRERGPRRPAKERIPDCYHRESQLSVRVVADDDQFDLDLHSDCSRPDALP